MINLSESLVPLNQKIQNSQKQTVQVLQKLTEIVETNDNYFHTDITLPVGILHQPNHVWLSCKWTIVVGNMYKCNNCNLFLTTTTTATTIKNMF